VKSALSYPTWDQVDVGCMRIATNVAPFEPTLIVGLARGGLIPAVRVSHMVSGVKFASVSYSAPDGNGETTGHTERNTTAIEEVLDYWEREPIKRVTIIDDIVDSGLTMCGVDDAFRSNGWEVQTACLYHRTNAVFQPDYSWQQIFPTDPWVHFPWEL